MDVLRKELNSIYEHQHLELETLDPAAVEQCKRQAETVAAVQQSCTVITDASADTCHIYGGSLARLLGLAEETPFYKPAASSDEDIIYNRIHPEDLVEKRMLEYEFFRHIDPLDPTEKTDYAATCRIRIRNARGEYIHVENSTQLLHPSPAGKIWLILCCYRLASDQSPAGDIRPSIVNRASGAITPLALNERRKDLLTAREKEILRLIREGKSSKQIACLLEISIHTVNRHRQNILGKLSVGNSPEAILAATAMRLL